MQSIFVKSDYLCVGVRIFLIDEKTFIPSVKSIFDLWSDLKYLAASIKFDFSLKLEPLKEENFFKYLVISKPSVSSKKRISKGKKSI